MIVRHLQDTRAVQDSQSFQLPFSLNLYADGLLCLTLQVRSLVLHESTRFLTWHTGYKSRNAVPILRSLLPLF